MNASDMGKKGAKKRWRGTTKAQRSEAMRAVALVRWAAGAGGVDENATPKEATDNVVFSDSLEKPL
jgi:hypothetical protein